VLLYDSVFLCVIRCVFQCSDRPSADTGEDFSGVPKPYRIGSHREILSGMSTHSEHVPFQRLWTSVVVSGFAAAILGVVMLIWPRPSIVVAAVLLGVYLAVSGIALVFSAFSLPVLSGGARFLNFLTGTASIILAVLAFRHFDEGGYAILLLAIWIAIGFILHGTSAAALAISDRQFPGRGWAIFFGIISIIAGVVVLAYPFESLRTLVLVAGIWLIILGVMEIVSGFGMRSATKKVAQVIDKVAA
jgi:uncharacterized membrane protein HdeD (DUF308 family)